MRSKSYLALVLICLVTFVTSARADTYAAFETTKYYSANRSYFVEVTEQRHATLYRNGPRLRRVWSTRLPYLPGKLFVTNDGKRVAIVDRYYGSGHAPETPVVIIMNQHRQIATHRLGDLANLKRTLMTTSAAHWSGKTHLSADEQDLEIETTVTKRDWDECHRSTPPAEMDKCWETIPYERLRFSLSSGKLIEKVSISSR